MKAPLSPDLERLPPDLSVSQKPFHYASARLTTQTQRRTSSTQTIAFKNRGPLQSSKALWSII